MYRHDESDDYAKDLTGALSYLDCVPAMLNEEALFAKPAAEPNRVVFYCLAAMRPKAMVMRKCNILHAQTSIN